MYKKSKRAAGYEDAKVRMKYLDLSRDYHELQKEADVTRSKLEAGKQRKTVLAAEVRFLQRRYEYFAKAKTLNPVQKEKLVHPPNLSTRTKHAMGLSRIGAGNHKLPPIPESKPDKKRYINKESDFYSNALPIGQHHSKLLHGGKEAAQPSLASFADLEHKGSTYIPKKKSKTGNITTIFDLNLNQDSAHNVKEVSFPKRAPTFDLNEISTGDEDFQSNFESLKFDEVKKGLTRGPDDEVQNDLMLSVCRNAAGEGSSHTKRKISWQDPFALRV